ncbi:hypothetical protein TRIP_C20241 [Candidatus Zixiibacteriota bacterium]|nr:hypothetical protein TRIP_C20241 [candidate division Zixibacteria bacterium]
MNGPGKFWQRGFYDHIIRDENDLNKRRAYMANNPLKLEIDQTR